MSIPRIHSAQRIRGIGSKLRMLLTIRSREKAGLLFLRDETNFASVKPVKVEPGQLFTRNITTGVTQELMKIDYFLLHCTSNI